MTKSFSIYDARLCCSETTLSFCVKEPVETGAGFFLEVRPELGRVLPQRRSENALRRPDSQFTPIASHLFWRRRVEIPLTISSRLFL